MIVPALKITDSLGQDLKRFPAGTRVIIDRFKIGGDFDWKS